MTRPKMAIKLRKAEKNIGSTKEETRQAREASRACHDSLTELSKLVSDVTRSDDDAPARRAAVPRAEEIEETCYQHAAKAQRHAKEAAALCEKTRSLLGPTIRFPLEQRSAAQRSLDGARECLSRASLQDQQVSTALQAAESAVAYLASEWSGADIAVDDETHEATRFQLEQATEAETRAREARQVCTDALQSFKRAAECARTAKEAADKLSERPSRVLRLHLDEASEADAVLRETKELSGISVKATRLLMKLKHPKSTKGGDEPQSKRAKCDQDEAEPRRPPCASLEAQKPSATTSQTESDATAEVIAGVPLESSESLWDFKADSLEELGDDMATSLRTYVLDELLGSIGRGIMSSTADDTEDRDTLDVALVKLWDDAPADYAVDFAHAMDSKDVTVDVICGKDLSRVAIHHDIYFVEGAMTDAAAPAASREGPRTLALSEGLRRLAKLIDERGVSRRIIAFVDVPPTESFVSSANTLVMEAFRDGSSVGEFVFSNSGNDLFTDVHVVPFDITYVPRASVTSE